MLKELLSPVFHHIKLVIFQFKWKKKNKHNFTCPKNVFPIERVKIGNYTYGDLNVYFYGSSIESLTVSHFCSIAGNTKFFCGGEHCFTRFSSYPFKYYLQSHHPEAISKGPIVVESDVWIGYGCTVLSGVTLGQGAVIAAGAVVTKNIPPYAIAGGVPAKVIKYRFTSDIIEKLLLFDYSKLSDQLIKKNIDMLYNNINEAYFQSDIYNQCKKF